MELDLLRVSTGHNPFIYRSMELPHTSKSEVMHKLSSIE
jgi:hypothetical protein